MKRCKCGCGEITLISQRTDKVKGFIRGEYRDFLPRHSRKGIKPWNYGKKLGKMSQENKNKISNALKGKTPKNIQSIAGWNRGIHLTQEWKQKLREAKLNNPVKYWKGKNTPIKGDLHWNWQGGKTTEREKARKTAQYKDWRKAIFERDNYTCQFCGKRGLEIQADHIKSWAGYPDLRYELSNGRTLCVPCHKTTDTYLNNREGRNQFLV